jgi:hypothetical protein
MFVFHPELDVLILEQKDLPRLCGSMHLVYGSISFMILAEYLFHLLHGITCCAKFHHQIMYFLFLGESLFHPIL